MAKRFHESQFDDATQDKLAVFRRYVREWIPVFVRPRKGTHNSVNLFDFFAGPGADAEGNPGSPCIVQDELRKYCETRGAPNAEAIKICLHFNDVNQKYVEQLRTRLDKTACRKGCCKMVFSSKPFQDALTDALAIMRRPGSANLVIMDQFGVKEVTPDVVNALARCGTTDILFFVSSSFVRRFAGEPSIQKYFNMSEDELASSNHKSIHRYVCDYFRSRLPVRTHFHLAPFSIKKGSNIYGIVFGSGSLRGLDKFLRVCWHLDEATGEANYDVDGDPAWPGDRLLFPEMNVTRKQDRFNQELTTMLQGTGVNDRSRPITNLEVYRFTLEHGFLPKHANEHLATLQRQGQLEVIDPQSGESIQKGAFHLYWEDHGGRKIRAIFQLKG